MADLILNIAIAFFFFFFGYNYGKRPNKPPKVKTKL